MVVTPTRGATAMPLDAKARIAGQRAPQRAEQLHGPAPRPLIPEAVFKERCCDHGEPSPEDPVLRWGRKVRGDAAKTASKFSLTFHELQRTRPGTQPLFWLTRQTWRRSRNNCNSRNS